ncbi:TniQ family protein [Rhizobium sp. NFR12]|uniref:TniQ family protein n=1 Tax=Rhizobium sp. NFR12 TaxID=1566261 RepID=UPI0008A77635|nr:TniQ family protein [Rhizobium sp. NFR12]SEH24084.1 TniQ protein [Rhizobium sp. NFR12]
MSNAPRRLYSYWPFPPAETEPAHGYSLRLVKAQGETSLRNFNIWNQIETEHPKPNRMMRDLEAHPIPEEWLSRLRANTPIRQGTFHHLRGHRLNFLQVRLQPRRWCRGCLHEEAYHRSWWDIESIHFCPFHGGELETTIEGAGSVTWKWLDFTHTSYGIDFGKQMDRIEGASPYARYLLGRFGWAEPFCAPLLDGLDISDVIEACEFVGQTLESPLRRETSPKGKHTAEIGFKALSGDRGDLAEALRRRLQTYDDIPDRENIMSYFQAPYVRLNELTRKSQGLVRRAFREAYVFEKEGLARRIVDSDLDVEFITTIEVGKRLGMGPQTARKIAAALGVYHGSRDLGTIAASAIAAIGDFRDGLITRWEAYKRLGLPKGTINHLVRAGFLTMFAAANVGKRTGGRFSPHEIDGLLRMIEALPITGKGDRPCKFNGYHLAYNMKPGELACACLRGEMTVIARRKGRGFMRLVLEGRPEGDPPRKPSAIPIIRDPGTVSLFEAEALLNLTGAAVRRLVRSGHLVAVKQHSKITLLKRDQVLAFGSAHATAADYATCLMIDPKLLGDRLVHLGAKPIVALGRDGKSGRALFKRADILRLLDLDVDPTVFDDPRIVRFWTAFSVVAAHRCPSLILPPRLPPHELFLRDARRSIRVTLRHKTGSAEISCVISALKAPKTRVFVDLGKEEDEISAIMLVDAISVAVDQGIKKLNASRRATYRNTKAGPAKAARP